MKETMTAGEVIEQLKLYPSGALVFLKMEHTVRAIKPDGFEAYDAEHQRIQYLYINGAK